MFGRVLRSRERNDISGDILLGRHSLEYVTQNFEAVGIIPAGACVRYSMHDSVDPLISKRQSNRSYCNILTDPAYC